MISRPLITATTRPILLSILAEGENYGYRIIQRVQNLSGGKLTWSVGMLYPALHSLENDGLVESVWRAVDNAPDRKYYRLTEKGRQALEAEKRQWIDVNAIFVQLWKSEPGLLAG